MGDFNDVALRKKKIKTTSTQINNRHVKSTITSVFINAVARRRTGRSFFKSS